MEKPPKDYPVEMTFVNSEGILCCYAKPEWGHPKKFSRKKIRKLDKILFLPKDKMNKWDKDDN